MKDKSVIITGAAGGIGRACVQAFVAAGARVVMADTDDSCRDLVEKLAEQRCRFVWTDVSADGSVKNMVAETSAAFGSIDVLVNNAALIPPMLPVHQTSMADFERVVAVNLRGPFLCCKHCYPHLKKSRGSIVNMSSMAGMCGEASHAVYSATKGALNSLTMAMAIDYGPDGIRCNAVCPSSVRTPATDKLINEKPNAEEIVEYRTKINHLGYTATPDQIASVVVFLASPAAGFITGAIVPVSGGSECGYGVKRT